jgi:uncharacterized protein YndB with AHSA1/START domain
MTVEINQLGPDVWEHRVFTTAPPTLVFDYLADFEKHVEWERELVAVKPLNRRTGHRGGAYLKTYDTRPRGLVGRIFSRGLRVTCKLSEVERPERIVWKQYRSHQASGPSSFQRLELLITPSESGSLIVLTRRFSGMEGISVDTVARFSSRWGQALQGLPPEFRVAAGGSKGGRPGLFSTPDEVVRHALDGHPSRGPGPTSLERLKAILDGGGRDAR